MRNQSRLNYSCGRLRDIWKKVPDWRLTQLMTNAFSLYQNRHGTDAFYVEDEEFLDFLEDFVDHYTNRK